jgi:hypothetical protein
MYMARGMGATPGQAVAIGGSLATPIVAHFAGAAVASALGISAAVAVPIVGAAFAGVLMGVQALLNSGCGPACVQTSEWANEAEKILTDNLDAYFSIPAPRPESARQAYIGIFNAVWDGLQQRCGQPGLSTAGRNCIQDRQRGACKWRQRAGAASLRYPGEPQPGECWNWFTGYLDPVLQDSQVVPDSALQIQQAGASISSAVGGFSMSSLFLALGIGAVVWGVAKS